MGVSKPRRLRIFRIIDSETGYFEVDPNLDAFDGLDSYIDARKSQDGDSVHRITGCVASQKFWQSQLLPTEPPDLLLVDINFERDSTSPLKRAEGKIPTGLLHALPFLAWSRTAGRITAVAFHTGDKTLFTTRDGDASHVMKLLAAELAGIAGAVHGTLLGEVVNGGMDRLDAKGDLDSAGYRWIWDLAPDAEHLARERVQAEYRRALLNAASLPAMTTEGGASSGALSRVVIEPESHAVLMRLVSEASSRSGTIRPSVEGWPGITLIRRDGHTDCIAVDSLFADSRVALQGIHFADSAEGDPERPWDLTDGKPAIGRYLRRLGQWQEVYEQAAAFASQLPLGAAQASTTLAKLIKNGAPPLPVEATGGTPVIPPVSNEKVVRFLTLLFQIIRQQHAAAEAWPKRYHELGWDPAGHRFTDTEPRGQTLPHFLTELFSNLLAHIEVERSDGDEAPRYLVAKEDLIDLLDKQKIDRVRVDVYIKLMVEAGLLTHSWKVGLIGSYEAMTIDLPYLAAIGAVQGSMRTGKVVPDRARLLSLFRDRTPMQTTDFTPEWIGEGGLSRTVLAENLGYGGDSMTAMSRIVSQGLGLARESDATAFLDEFESGTTKYGWLRELCRQYARKRLGWSDERNWPRILRGQ